MVSIVYKRYAQGLYDLAINNDKTDDIQRDILNIKEFFNPETQLAKVLNHPRVNEDEKLQLLKNAFNGKVSDEIIGLLTIVLRKNRQNILSQIFDEYLDMVKKGENISTALVTSAVPLAEETTKKIHDRLKKTLNKDVEMQAKVDTTILGGLKIQVDNMIFDRTLNGRLEELKKAL